VTLPKINGGDAGHLHKNAGLLPMYISNILRTRFLIFFISYLLDEESSYFFLHGISRSKRIENQEEKENRYASVLFYVCSDFKGGDIEIGFESLLTFCG
jgi:hypothetical protein